MDRLESDGIIRYKIGETTLDHHQLATIHVATSWSEKRLDVGASGLFYDLQHVHLVLNL
jgi:hypothetical protein